MSLTLYNNGAIRIEVKYLQFKGNTWYFRRRIPDDVRQLHPGRNGLFFFSLGTSDLGEASKRADLHARGQDALWKAHRGGAVDVGPDVHSEALAFLDAYGLKPGQHEQWKRAGLEPDAFLNQLSYLSDGEGEIVREQLPRYAELAAELYYGAQKSVPFLSEAASLFQQLKAEEEGMKEHAARLRAVRRFMDEAEVIHRRGPWRNLEAVEYAALEWVDWFNNCRLLEPIGNIPPAEAEANFYDALEAGPMAAQLSQTSLRQTRRGSNRKLAAG